MMNWISSIKSTRPTHELARALYERAHSDTDLASYHTLIREGANIHAHVKHPIHPYKASMLGLSIGWPDATRLLIGHGAMADHALIEAFLQLVSSPAQNAVFSHVQRHIGTKYTSSALIALENGFHPKTKFDQIDKMLSKTVRDRTSFQHPEAPFRSILAHRTPLVWERIEILINQAQLNKATLIVPERGTSGSKPRL